MRQCPFRGCTRTIPDSMFACRPHWFSLSKEQRDRIWAAYRAYQCDQMGMQELRDLQGQVLAEAQGIEG